MIFRSLIAVAVIVMTMGGGTVGNSAGAAELESAIARGGRLYDNWYKEKKLDRPEKAHASYPADGKYPKQSWRCKECHGWDYRGKDGANAKTDHNIGVKGINAVAGKDPAAIAAVFRDKTHGYTAEQLNDKDVQDLALFVAKGQMDTAKFIDLASGKPKGNPAKGEVYFNTLCAGCHGFDGKKVSTGVPLGQAADNPWDMLHKAFNGLPAEAMPALRSLDPNIAADTVAYTQSLPK